MTHHPARPELALELQEAALTARHSEAGVSELLDRYGVTVVLSATYEWGGYRYSNANDAVAAAMRHEVRGTRQ